MTDFHRISMMPFAALSQPRSVLSLLRSVMLSLVVPVVISAASTFGPTSSAMAMGAKKISATETTDAKETPLLLIDHKLTDSLWQPSTGKRVDVPTLAKALASADFVMLGEKHDNPNHHMLQYIMLSLTLSSGRGGAITFEMVEPRHQQALADAIAAKKAALEPEATSEREERLANLGKALEWEKRGWPDWQSYSLLFGDALDQKLSLHPGNPNRSDLMPLARGGTLSDIMLKDLRWDNEYDEVQKDSLLDELYESHCGMMERTALTPLATLQRFKDAHMARSMRHAHRQGEASILIAGNGHVRKDRGVAKFLDTDKTMVSVGLIEVARGEDDPKSYPAFDPALYDFVWFTPRVDEDDPCDKFKEQLEAMKKKMGSRKHGKTDKAQ